MTTMFGIFATSAILGLGVGVAPASAGRALEGWVACVDAQIDGWLCRAGGGPGALPAGRVSVRFMRGADGRARDVQVARSSGSVVLDDEALRTVRALHDLAPLPAGFDPTTPVRVDLAFGPTGDAASHLARMVDAPEVPPGGRAQDERINFPGRLDSLGPG